jgi:multiple sugar transport system substrate-binding protein
MVSDGGKIHPLLEQFQAEQHLSVQLHRLSFDTGWSELVKFALYNDGPDLSEIGSAWVGDLVAMNALHPLNAAEIKALGGPAAFVPSAWRGGMLAGSPQLWAVPWTTGARLLFYRRDLLQRAGVPEATAFQTTEHLAHTLNRLEAAGVKLPWTVPTSLTHTTLLNAASWVWEAGGDFLTPDGRQTLFNHPAARAGLRAYFELGHFLGAEAQGRTASDSDKLFLFADDVGVTLSGPWLFGAERAQEIKDLGVALPPGASYVGGSYLVVWGHSRKKEAALKLIEFLTRREAQVNFSQAVGLLPARLEALASPPFSTDPFWQMAVNGLHTGRSFPVTRSWGLAEDRLTKALSGLWDEFLANPQVDLESALAQRLEPLAKRLDLILSQDKKELEKGPN